MEGPAPVDQEVMSINVPRDVTLQKTALDLESRALVPICGRRDGEGDGNRELLTGVPKDSGAIRPRRALGG